MSTPKKMVSPAELFALDGGQGSVARELSLRRIVPIAPIGEDDLLDLAARARWPEQTPIAGVLAAAVQERLHASSRGIRQALSDRSDPDIGWNLISRRGITGPLGGLELLVGTRRFVEDAGIDIAESARRVLLEHDGLGWTSVLVAARSRDAPPHEPHRSLIGILAFDSKAETSTPADQPTSKTTVRAARPKQL